jgi:hypothetical protein
VTQSPYDVGFPTAPCTDPQTGEVTPAWRKFLQVLWARTGETTAPARGVSLAALGALPSVTVIPSASPFAYTAPSFGTLYVAGGGVTAMTLRRGSGVAFLVGAFYGGKRMAPDDVLTITYSTAPIINFLPG